jgi:hypothetical protein
VSFWQGRVKDDIGAIEIGFILIAAVARKTGGLLAIEGHQLGQSAGGADGLLVIGNGLLGFGDRRTILPKSVQPKPPLDGLLVRFQNVLAQAKTGVKKRPVAPGARRDPGPGLGILYDQNSRAWL